MQLIVLLLIMALMVHDSRPAAGSPMADHWALSAAILPQAILFCVGWLACHFVASRLERAAARARGAVRCLEHLLGGITWAALLLFYGQIFGAGWLTWLERHLGGWILLPELVALLPTLLLFVGLWAVYYPVDSRLRTAAWSAGTARPAMPQWTRRQYVVTQVRHQLLLVLVPLILLLGWSQAVPELLGEPRRASATQSLLTLAGAAVIFLLAPVLLRHVWDTVDLPPGSLRDRLVRLCRRYAVGFRKLLLWRTYGVMINGAVMGLVGPLRYIMLTDGLVDRLEERQVEAVLAHEIGHVRRHHMPWLAISAFAAIGVTVFLLQLLLVAGNQLLGGERVAEMDRWAAKTEWVAGVGPDAAIQAGLVLLVLLGWAGVFGFVSRRFERQADTFAVQHLARTYPDPDVAEGRIGPTAVRIMAGALERVAELNHMSMTRRSWRHGSMSWRLNHLYTLLGEPIDDLRIDRQVRWIRWASVSVIVLVLAARAAESAYS